MELPNAVYDVGANYGTQCYPDAPKGKSMRLKTIPKSVRQLKKLDERIQALQLLVNGILHRANVCPVGQYMAGPTTNVINVSHRHRHYHLSNTWDQDAHLLKFVVEELNK